MKRVSLQLVRSYTYLKVFHQEIHGFHPLDPINTIFEMIAEVSK